MSFSSFLIRLAHCCVALALAIAVTTGVNAQAPLVPYLLTASHHHSIAAPPSLDRSPAIQSGISAISEPRFGSAATRDFFAPFLVPNIAPAWNSVGPDSVLNAYGTVGGNADTVSGRVAAIAVDPTNNNILYIASAGGGVWKSADAGNSYIPTTDFLGDTAMGSIAIAPSNSSVIYAGTGEANNSGDSQYGIGLLKSTDGAVSWSLIPGPGNAFFRRAISKIVVNPTNANIVYLTITDFAENGLGGNTGVWKTTDGGSTWTNMTAVAGLDSNQPYTDLVMDPTQSNTLYAAIGTLFGASANGVYKTTNGGTTWTKLTGFPSANVGRISLALASSAPATIYASVASSADYSLLGLYKTTNGGTTWVRKSAAPNYLGGQGWYDNVIVVSPTNPNQVFAGGQVNYDGSLGSYFALAGSQDGGTTFQDYSIGIGMIGPHTDLHALTFTADGSALLDGNDGGVWRLENPSAAGNASTTQWTDINANLGTLQFTGIALHPTDPTIAYGGSQDNGTEKYTGTLAWSQVRGGDGGFTRVDQSNPNTVYHEYYGISLERSDDGGNTWNGATNGINPNDPQPARDGSDPAAFYVPYKLDPANQSRVIYGTDHVYQSLNRGDSFTVIGTPGVAGYNPGDAIMTTLGVYGNTIYAATSTNLYVTFNDGTSWADVSIPSFNGRYSNIFVDPANTSDVYVSRSNFGSGKVFHSTNGGATWTDISSNLPDEPFNAILLDTQFGILYAGGDDGVYSSANFGGTWSRLDPGGNFPTVQVVDLALSPGANVIGAGTHGRGLFEILRTSGVSTAVTVANVTGAAGTTVTLSGTLKTSGNVALSGETLTFQVGTTTVGTAVTNSSGVATLSYAIPGNAPVGSQTITVSFAGDANNNSSSGTGTLTVTATNTVVTVSNATGAAGTTVMLSGTMKTLKGTPFNGYTLTFMVGTTTVGTAVTNSSGVATISYAIPSGTPAGSQTITVSFAGQGIYSSSSGTGTLTVTASKANTAVTVANVTGAAGTTVTLSGTLKTSGNVALSGETLTFQVGTTTVGTAVTNSSGVATLSYAIPGNAPVGSQTITVSFAGDANNNSSSGTGTLTVTATNTVVTVSNATGAAGTTVMLSGTMKTLKGTPFNGYTLTFMVGTTTVGTAVTNSSGVATISYAIPSGTPAGSQTITVSFAGQGIYSSSSGTGTLTVTASKANTVVTVANVTGAAGTTVTLSGTLKTSGNVALSGETLTFQVGTTTVGTAVTNASGVATISYAIPSGTPAGSQPITVSFAGDTSNNLSSGTGTLTVTATNTVITVANVSGSAGTTVMLSGTMKTLKGTPFNGYTLTFMVGTTTVGTAVTNSSGVATISYAIPSGTPAGSQPITVSFAGQGIYSSSSGTGTLTVQ